jgi:2-dehydro-3-deoxyphosphogluconate aldolase/(4S)-4-hydroxy-2-oxoglutarate aldolase
MDKREVLDIIFETKLVAIIRTESPHQVVEIARSLEEGGIKAIEITMTVPDAVALVREARQSLEPGVLLGAGTVLDAETGRACILAGADFIVSPTADIGLIALCNRYGVAVVPGTLTPTEVLAAWQAGADLIKVFPAGDLGPGYIRSLRGPLPQVPLMPTGGIALDNASAFIQAGATALGVGSSLVGRGELSRQGLRELTERARKLVEAIAGG